MNQSFTFPDLTEINKVKAIRRLFGTFLALVMITIGTLNISGHTCSFRNYFCDDYKFLK